MKKIISLLICISIMNFNAIFALEEAIVDDFAIQTLDKNLKIKKENYAPITDNFAKNTLNPNLKINIAKNETIDDFLIKSIKAVELTFYDKNQKYDFEKLQISQAFIRPNKYATTRKNLSVGDKVTFEITDNLNINNKTYKKGTQIIARVENLNENRAYGVPADMIISNFKLPDNKILNGEISLKGANRALWVYPLSYTLSVFFGLGIFTLAIRGGHAKLKPRKTYVLNFENF